MSTSDAPQRKPLPRIRGTQLGLHTPEQIDKIKADMLAGRYAYHEERGRLYGVTDPSGVLYVLIGHHRMVAALEILQEIGNDWYVRKLIEMGSWPEITFRPIDGRPMPSRHWWGAFRNWLGY